MSKREIRYICGRCRAKHYYDSFMVCCEFDDMGGNEGQAESNATERVYRKKAHGLDDREHQEALNEKASEEAMERERENAADHAPEAEGDYMGPDEAQEWHDYDPGLENADR